MDDSVAKVSGENLSLDRLKDYKTNARVNFICPILYFFVEPKKFFFVIYLKSQSVNRVPFILSGIVISLKQVV